MLGSPEYVTAKQVVCDGGLYFDGRKQRVQRRRHDLSRAECRRADEHDLAGERRGIGPALQDIDGRHVGKGAFDAAIPHEDMALAVERNPPIAEAQGDGVGVGDTQDVMARVTCRRHRRQRERRINAALVLQQHGHAAENAVGIRCGVQKARCRCGRHQR